LTFNINKSFLFCITIIYFILANILTLNFNNIAYEFDNKWILLFFFCIITIPILLKIETRMNKEKIFIIVIWELLFFTIFSSKILFDDFNFLELLLYSLLIPLLFFSKTIIQVKEVFIFASLFATIPFLIIAEAGNSIGILLCFFGMLLINYMFKRNIKPKYLMLTIGVICIFIFFTKSRTSLISFFSVSMIYVINYLTIRAKSYIQIIKKTFYLFLIISILFITYSYVETLFFSKWGFTNENLTSNRSEMWLNTINNGVTMFGNGEGYFYKYYLIKDAHNTFVQALGAYGLLSLIMILILFFYIFYKCIKIGKIEYYVFFGGYFLLSLAENLLFINSRLIGIDLLFFIFLGCVINESPKRGKQHEEGRII
jgi:hypothetical protein